MKININFLENYICIVLSSIFKDNLLDFEIWKPYFFPSVQKSRGQEQIVFGLLVRTWKEKAALKEFQPRQKNEMFWYEVSELMYQFVQRDGGCSLPGNM